MTFNVIVGTHRWITGGVTTFISNLVSGLIAKGMNARVLVTVGIQNGPPANFPLDVAPWGAERSLSVGWKAMIGYLENLAPCVYLPNGDLVYSCVSPRLSNRVVIVGNIHSDHAVEHEHFARLGRFWNQTVAGSEYLRQKIAAQHPDLATRLCVLPYGVAIPEVPPARTPTPDAPLRILYAGRFTQAGKRVFDLPKIVDALARRLVPVQLSLTGWGQDEQALRTACHHLSERGMVHFHGVVSEERLFQIYEENDVLILTSEYEGKPLSLTEGMGRGCVPVATDIPSGVPELVQNGRNGFLVPVGAIEEFADRLAELHRDLRLRERLSTSAFQTVSQGGYRIGDMVDAYAALFTRLMTEAASGQFRRPRGRIRLPAHLMWMQPTWKDRLPESARTVGRRCRATLRRISRRSSLDVPIDQVK